MKIEAKRRKRLVAILQRAGIGSAALVPGPNFTYLTGVHLHLMERITLFLVCADGTQFAVMPSLEKQKWASAMPDVETFYWTDNDGPAEALTALAQAISTENLLGIEGLRMRASEFLALRAHWNSEKIVDADPYLSELRLLKDADEIAGLRKAISISEIALGETYDGGIGGRTEAEISARLKAAMLAHGATGFAFDPIVLSGSEAANPHGDTGARVVRPGQALLIDFGASNGNMHADITRTVFCEYAPDEHAAIYETVLAANMAGKSAACAGVPVGDVDAAATDVLKASAYRDLILHKTGHGLGREVHEAPQVMQTNRTLQQPGMVFTIEPGLYREGEIGIRIEDNVLITEVGHDCLTSFTRELLTIA